MNQIFTLNENKLHKEDNSTSKVNNNFYKKSINFCGKNITLESGRMASQTNGSVLISGGGTVVLNTVVFSRSNIENLNFLPLSVNYREMMHAAGKIPGGFVKRESKPSDGEILTSRIIDRSIRPLFPKNFCREVQVISTVLSYDKQYDPSVLAVIGTSASLAIAGLPLSDVISAVRIGYIDGNPVFFPSVGDKSLEQLDAFVSGSTKGISMVEAASSGIKEEEFVKILDQALEFFTPVLEVIEDMKNTIGSNEVMYTEPLNEAVQDEIQDSINKLREHSLIKSLKKTLFVQPNRKSRNEVLFNLKDKLQKEFQDLEQDTIDTIVSEELRLLLRKEILENDLRIDHRSAQCIRNISCEVGILPRTHGSALFTRGNTQALATVTLGSEEDCQISSDLEGVRKENFLLHYNFHPYSAGEIGALRAPSRREINHGYLALRSLAPVMPDKSDFPYTVRVTSEILESCGSTSMATICAGMLSLLDAGVPIKDMVAGIAMGLVIEGDKRSILSDISVEEDGAGDMDFKIAGTRSNITSVQMDIKVDFVSKDLMLEVLKQAKIGRLHILDKMSAVISDPSQLSQHAPIYHSMKIDKDDIKGLIGSGGRTIKDICETMQCKIDIAPDGNVTIFSPNSDMLKNTIDKINAVLGKDVDVGDKFTAKVVKIINSGFFVQYNDNKDGFVHISEIKDGHVDDVKNHVDIGESVNVVVIGIEFGKVRFSLRKYDLELSQIQADNISNVKRKSNKVDRDKKPYNKHDRVKNKFENKHDFRGRNRDRNTFSNSSQQNDSKKNNDVGNPSRKYF